MYSPVLVPGFQEKTHASLSSKIAQREQPIARTGNGLEPILDLFDLGLGEKPESET